MFRLQLLFPMAAESLRKLKMTQHKTLDSWSGCQPLCSVCV